MSPDPMKVVPARLPADEAAALAGWATLRGSNPSEEIRLAVRLHLRELMLAHVLHDDGREDVRRQGLDPDSEAEWLAASLAELRAQAYPAVPPTPSRRPFAPQLETEAV